MKNLNDALLFAIETMGVERKDRGGHAYSLHLAQVIVGCREFAIEKGLDPNDDEMLQAAALHDTIEDSDVTAADLLAEGFSERVVVMVQNLSRAEGQPYVEYLANIIGAALSEPALIAIKTADLQSNSDPTRLPGPVARPQDMARLSLYASALERLSASTATEAAAADLQMVASEHGAGRLTAQQAGNLTHEILLAAQRHAGGSDPQALMQAILIENSAIKERVQNRARLIGEAYGRHWFDRQKKSPEG